MNSLSRTPTEPSPGPGRLSLRLYVAGKLPRAETAKANLRRICAGLGPSQPQIDIVDVFLAPERTFVDAIVVTPTLVRLYPKPVVKIVGTLSDLARVRSALGLHDPVAKEAS